MSLLPFTASLIKHSAVHDYTVLSPAAVTLLQCDGIRMRCALCRLKFLSQEIVVFREELSWQMQRACVIPPALDLDSDPFHHVRAGHVSAFSARVPI